MIGDKFTLQANADRAFPLAFGLRLGYRAVAGSPTITYHDLTGWTFAATMKRTAREQDMPATNAPTDFAFTTAIASPQTGDTKGVVYFTVPAVTTGATSLLGVPLFAGQLIAIPAGGNPRVIGDFLVRFRDSTTVNPDASSGSVITPDIIIDGTGSDDGTGGITVVEVGQLGAATGVSFLARGVTVNLLTTGAKDIFTAAGDTVVTGLILRGGTITGLVDLPQGNVRRSDGELFAPTDELIGLNDTDKAFVWQFSGGSMPLLATGDKLQYDCTTAANATAYTLKADVLGYTF